MDTVQLNAIINDVAEQMGVPNGVSIQTWKGEGEPLTFTARVSFAVARQFSESDDEEYIRREVARVLKNVVALCVLAEGKASRD